MLFIYFFCKIGVGLINIYIQSIELWKSKSYLDILHFWKKLSIQVSIIAKQILEKKNINYDSIQSKCIKYK